MISLALAVLMAAAAPAERIEAFCIDFNWGPDGVAPPGMFAAASPAEHVAWYRDLGVNTIQTFCVSVNGYAWYRGDVVPPQPGLKGDFLKETVELGHGAGMKVVGYFCAGSNEYWSRSHPELSHPFSGAIAIPFTTEYLDYLCKAIDEAVTRTGIDGFMLDWFYNASHFYPDREYRWLDCEKRMYAELFNEPWPGDEAMDDARTQEFNRRALARAWDRIRAAAKKAKPDCIIWLTCFDLQHPQLQGARVLQEADWLMNEHSDPEKLVQARALAGPQTRLIQCVSGWGGKHDAAKVLAAPRFADVGIYGFIRPDVESTLPVEGATGDAANIAAMRRAFGGRE